MKGDWSNTALILAAHGSHQHDESIELIQRHAKTIRDMKLFTDVIAGFWHGQPSLSNLLSMTQQNTAYVVPVFQSEGHFTRVIIPREMGLDKPTTFRPKTRGPDKVFLCPPVGNHPDIPKLVKSLATEACAKSEISVNDAHIIIVGHGGRTSSGSEQATVKVAEALQGSGVFRSVRALYLEQDPLVETWRQDIEPKNIVVVPFLIGGGSHEKEISDRMSPDNGERLVVTRPVGAVSNISQMIVDQVIIHQRSLNVSDFDEN